MQRLLSELTKAERRLGDALDHLRDQQALVSQYADARNHADFVVLLSNTLWQFYKIEEHRNAVVEGLGEFLPLRRSRPAAI